METSAQDYRIVVTQIVRPWSKWSKCKESTVLACSQSKMWLMVKSFPLIIAQLLSQKKNLKALAVCVELLNAQAVFFNWPQIKSTSKLWKSTITSSIGMSFYIWLSRRAKLLELLKQTRTYLMSSDLEVVLWKDYPNGLLSGLVLSASISVLKRLCIRKCLNQNTLILIWKLFNLMPRTNEISSYRMLQ